MRLLVTGAAGFIGSNYVRRMLERCLSRPRRHVRHRSRSADLRRDADEPDRRSRATPGTRFVAGGHPGRRPPRGPGARSRRDRPLRRRVPRRPLDHRRGRLRPHQRPGHAEAAAGRTRRRRRQVRARLHRRGVRLHRRGLVGGGPAAGAQLALLGVQGVLRSGRPGLRPHLRHERLHHALLQQLRLAPVPREGHPAVRHQPDGRQEGAAVRGRAQHPRLAARRRPLPRHPAGARRRAGRARSTTSAAAPS